MNISEAIKTLDDVIPSPDNKMVDFKHLPIAVAWETIKDDIERLKAENEYKTEAIRFAVKISEEGEKELIKIRKETAKEILDEVSKHYGGVWLVELYKKYGLEVEE